MKVLKIALCILLGGAAVIAVYRFGLRKSIPDAPVTEQVMSILQQNDCFVCHSRNPQLPFYSSFPIIGPKMAEHAYHAYRFTDLESKLTGDVDEVTLSILECDCYRILPACLCFSLPTIPLTTWSVASPSNAAHLSQSARTVGLAVE